MATHFTDDVIHNIETLENPKTTIRPPHAEQIYYNIVAPLLRHDGYHIVDPSVADRGVDLEATEMISAARLPARIAFQFKHYLSRVDTKEILSQVGHAVLDDYQKICVVSRSGFTRAAIERAARSPYAIELVDINFLKSWAYRIKNELVADAKEKYGRLIKAFTTLIVEQILANPFFLDQIEWRELEKVIAELFDGLGFDVELTPPSKDGGKDVILEYKIAGQPKSSIVEVKHWKSKTKVGNKSVLEFVEVVITEKRDSGIYLSTYGYTENAFATLTEIQRGKIRSSDQKKIYSLCKTYHKAKQGLWALPDDLDSILYEDTHQT